MPRKKENTTGPLPGFDIFDRPLAEQDRGVLLKPHYRRKHLSGFVPLWNEFFRCYHQAQVSPLAVYLWAYLRQYEHERREWNAVSDISWPGRRDMAEALGVSISHLPNLLNELRQAGLISFQLVLPGFEELAGSLGTSIEEVRERAAEYGVSPKVDGTLYRTADPFTKTEFATSTRLKFCKGCKAYRYCEGVKEAQERIKSGELAAAKPRVLINKGVAKAQLEEAPNERKISQVTASNNASLATPQLSPLNQLKTNRIQESTASESKKVRPANLNRVEERIGIITVGESKKEHRANPSRVKTSSINQTVNNQLRITTNQKQELQYISLDAIPANQKELVVEELSSEKSSDDQNQEADQILLLRFGFDPQTTNRLIKLAQDYGKPTGYIQGIVQYARESARQNPLGLARHLIERGEERLGRTSRWQQQSLFEPKPAEPELPVEAEPESNLQARIAAVYQLPRSEIVWWNTITEQLKQKGQLQAAEIFGAGLGVRQPQRRLVVVLRSLFDQHRALGFVGQLEQVLASNTGLLFKIELVNFISLT